MLETCEHYWEIEPPNGNKVLSGACKHCGAQRTFDNRPRDPSARAFDALNRIGQEQFTGNSIDDVYPNAIPARNLKRDPNA